MKYLTNTKTGYLWADKHWAFSHKDFILLLLLLFNRFFKCQEFLSFMEDRLRDSLGDGGQGIPEHTQELPCWLGNNIHATNLLIGGS